MKLPSFSLASAASCPTCHVEVAAAAKFCPNCGLSLKPTGAPPPLPAVTCRQCGGRGTNFPPDLVYCSECRWLRPLSPGYELPLEAFLWKFDADAMKVLQSMGPLTSAAHAISKRIGRPWLEASVTGVRLSERQIPNIFQLAIRAARVIGLSVLPEIYISGDQGWEAMTLGSDTSSFIVLGSMLTRFRAPEQLFLLGREMGHVRAGHALWRTITQLASGNTQRKSNLLSDGFLHLLSPSRLVESAIDAPLMAWSRQAAVTADRAGLLVSGNVDVARRVFLTSSLRLFPLFDQIDMQDWLGQEQEAPDMTSQVSEWTSANAPYLTRRLRLMSEFAASPSFLSMRSSIASLAGPEPQTPPVPGPMLGAPRPPLPPQAADVLRFKCEACSGAIKIERAALAGRTAVNIRCPLCKAITKITVTQT